MIMPNLQVFAEKIAEIKKLKILQFVGKGAFKETFLIADSSGNLRALKVFIPERMNIDRSIREIDAMKSCSCPNIAKLIEFDSIHLNGHSNVFYMMEEYYDGGTLAEKGCKDYSEILQLGYDISVAIEHLNEKRIVHRDIKPDNIMFKKNSNSAILVDLGLVRKLGETSLTFSWAPQGPGTPLFSAPEQLLNEKELIDWRTDQFSLGIVLSMYILNRHPFQHDGDDLRMAIQRVANREELPSNTVHELKKKNFSEVIVMLNPWPIKRINCTEKLLTIFRGGHNV